MLFAIEDIGFGGIVKAFRHEDGFDEILNFFYFWDEAAEALLGIVARFLFEEGNDFLTDAHRVFFVAFCGGKERLLDSIDDFVRIERGCPPVSFLYQFNSHVRRFFR